MNATICAAWLATAVSAPPTSVCSLEYLYWLRPEPARYVIVVATADSAPAALWRPDTSLHPWRRREALSPRRTPPDRVIVWGQVVHVVRVADGSRAQIHSSPRMATVVQWGRGGDCERVPSHALWMEPGDTVFIPDVAARSDSLPRSVSAERMSRFETAWGMVTYSPQRTRRAWPGTSVLTIQEFESFYHALPRADAWHRDPVDAARPLWAWVAAHPTLAAHSQAREWIAVVRRELEEARERMSPPPGA